MKEDWCSGFFEYWYTWKLERIEIGELLCKPHDKTCSSHGIFRRTHEANLILATPIATIASLGCWFKHTTRMFERIFGKTRKDFEV